MNRRGFLTGLLATTAASPPAYPMDVKSVPLLRSVKRLHGVVFIEEYIRAESAGLFDQLWIDQVMYGCHMTKTTAEFPFIERIDPREFLNPDTLVTFNA